MRILIYMITFLFFMDNLYFLHQREEDEDGTSSKVTLSVLPTGVVEVFSIGKHHNNRNAKRQKTSGERNISRLFFRLFLSLTIITAIAYIDSYLQYTDKKIFKISNFSRCSGDASSNVQSKYADLFADVNLNNTNHLSEWRMPSFLKRHRLPRNVSAVVSPSHLQKLFEEVADLSVSEGNGLNVMRNEWARYGSFKTFPEDSPAMPGRLAAAGFYHIGPADRVQCFSCKLIYSNWKTEDIPFEVHRRLSPCCKFLEDNEDGNLSIHEDSIRSHVYGAQAHTYNGTARNTHSNFCANGAGVEINNALQDDQFVQDAAESDFLAICKYPQYKEYAVRLSSYSKWPCGGTEDPRNLAEAGFFYAGFSDCVRCFCCGLGLRNWEYGDEAWSEHERWSAECRYVSSRIRNNSHNDQSREQDNNTPSTFEISQGDEYEGHQNQSEDLEAVNNGCVLQALEMGFDRQIVQDAFQECSENTRERGEPVTCEQLLEMVLSIQTSQQTRSAATSDVINQSDVKLQTDITGAASKAATTTAAPPTNTCSGNNFLDRLSPKCAAKASITSYDAGISIDCLREENRRLKDQLLCKICLDKEANMVLIPCGHMVSCQICAPALRKCPMCRKLVKDRVKAFLS